MSAFGKKGVRCDGCGKIANNRDGEYVVKGSPNACYINSHGRDCPHDFCETCEEALAPDYACPKCGVKPE